MTRSSILPFLAILLGSAIGLLVPAFGVEQRPLVINQTTGKQEQLQTANTLLVPGQFTIGGSAFSIAQMTLGGSTITGAAQIGMFIPFTGTASATSAIRGLQTAIATPGAGTTFSEVSGILFANNTAGSGDTITRSQSLFISPQDRGSHNASILHDFSAVYTGNWFIYDGFTYPSRFGGVVTLASNTNSTSTTTGGLVVTGGIGVGGAVTIGGTNLTLATLGGALRIKEGVNATMGVSTLVGGTVTVNTAAVTATSRIQLTAQTLGTIMRPAALGVTARSAGASFTITSGDPTDTSTVAWVLVEPAP